MLVRSALLLTATLLSACAAPATVASVATPSPGAQPERTSARVLSVVDGDTIRVAIGATSYPVRYIGMDAPEATGAPQPFAAEATDANRRLVEGREVLLEKDVSETDVFGRLLRYVYVDVGGSTLMVNAELVRLGYARVATYPPDVAHQPELLALEREARAAGRGLWGRN